MGKAYYSKEDAIRRLHDTLCIYDGIPVYVSLDTEFGDPEFTVRCTPLKYFYLDRKKHPWSKVLYTDPKFDYRQIPLGYGFSEKQGGAYYARIPDRKQSQGLSVSTLRVDGKQVMGTTTWLLTEAMENCILGAYPDLDWAVDMVKLGKHTTIPFGRKMAVSRIDRGLICLKYRRRAVGILEGKYAFRLLDTKDKSFLKPIFVNAGVEVR